MKNNKPIQVFEYQQLPIGKQGFTKSHWDALGWYNEKHGGSFFSLTPGGVKFNQYVGVIQVGNVTIEILPKISRSVEESNKTKWQKVLIDMLRECHWMNVYANDKASLHFKPNSILEAYLELFIHECEELVRQGLVKKYRLIDDNYKALKGKLLFQKQIQVNLTHKERFYTRHLIYDKENIYNQILLKALKLIPVLSQSPFLKDKVLNLVLSFPELEDITVNTTTFENLIYDRKTSRYKEAIEIAAMLLLNYRPDIKTGNNHVLAILFDMNDLWEEYIYRQLNRNKPPDWTIRPQNQKKFWALTKSNHSKVIRPDIVISNLTTKKRIILDTKWKIPLNNIPSDADLKQMFVYNEYWNGKNAILVYPNESFTQKPLFYEGEFSMKEKASETHRCGIMKMAVLDKDNSFLDVSIGKRINDFIKEKEML